MAETAAHLVDSILPHVPVRHWVLSFPPPLRYLLAYDAKATTAVLGVFLAEVFRWQRHCAKDELGLDSVEDAYPGAVTAIHRAGGALNLNLHAHSLVLDGVFVLEDGEAVFHALPAPDKHDLADIAWNSCVGTQRVLRRLGRDWDLPADELDVEALTDPLLVECAAASMSNTMLLGDQPGRAVLQLGIPMPVQYEPDDVRPTHGFDLHAGTRVSARDRKRLERLCRYVLRPPISHDRLALLDDGRVRVELKTPWRDGTQYLVMDALDFIARLVPLVPPPGTHQIRYHGVLAPNSKLRPLVIPPRPAPLPEQLDLPFGDDTTKGCAPQHRRSASGLSKLQRISWARLLERTMDYDMETCPECGAVMEVVGFVLDPAEIAAALDGVDAPDFDRTAHPPRGPPVPLQLSFDFAKRRRAPRREPARLAP